MDADIDLVLTRRIFALQASSESGTLALASASRATHAASVPYRDIITYWGVVAHLALLAEVTGAPTLAEQRQRDLDADIQWWVDHVAVDWDLSD